MIPEVGGSKPLGHPTRTCALPSGKDGAPTRQAARRRSRTRAQRGVERRRARSVKPLTVEPRREHTLAVEQEVLHELVAVDGLQRRDRRRQTRSDGAARAPSVAGELAVGHRVRRREVDGARRASGVDSACRIAAISSSSEIQIIHCVPDAGAAADAEAERGQSSCLSTPPWRASTRPVRILTTRMPDVGGRRAAASHSVHTSARKSSPGTLTSVSSSSPRSP